MSGVFRRFRTPTKTSTLPAFRWTYWRDYTASEVAYRTHSSSGGIDHLKLHLTYKKREEKGLWWWASCAVNVCPRSTIRHHYARQLRRGFEEALKARGFAKDGSRVKSDDKDGIKDLTGTLQILANAKVADPKWDNLQAQLLQMLDSVIKLQHRGQDNTGRSFVRTQPHPLRGKRNATGRNDAKSGNSGSQPPKDESTPLDW